MLSARQRDGMIHVLVVVPRARAQAVSASSLAPAGEPVLEALLDRGAQVFSIEPLQHPSPPPADGRR
jgi:hypothetical protein